MPAQHYVWSSQDHQWIGDANRISPPAPPTAQPLFAGHVPGRVLLGMSTASGSPIRPGFTEAKDIIGDPYAGMIGEYREFLDTFTVSALNAQLAIADADNQLAVLSSKVGANNWANVPSGFADAQLDAVVSVATTRAGQGKRPFLATIYHEPQGDGPSGNDLNDLPLWAAMNTYAMEYVTARVPPGSVAWGFIPNGNWWGFKNANYKRDWIAATFTDTIVSKIVAKKGFIFPDFYDADPPNADPFNPGGWQGNEDRASVKIRGFVEWANGVANGTRLRVSTANAGKFGIGCGELGTVDVTELQTVWEYITSPSVSKTWAVCNYFNSFNNSRWEWRLIPDSYPALNGTNGKGLTDIGGTPITEQRLVYYRSMLQEMSV